MKSLPFKRSKSRANKDEDGEGGIGRLASHIPSQGDVALPIPGVSGGDKQEPSEPGALGCAGGHGRSSPPPPAPR